MASVAFELNGEPVSCEPRHHTAVDLFREQLGLTGTKLSCGTGSCGACVVGVDGVPVAGCLLPSESLSGRSITTIEGIAAERGLHPVQRAFIDNDGLQCGFCTPGFVIEAVAFYDVWREHHGTRRPTRDDIAKALAGHLCRCGAYDGIYRAVGDACEGRYDDARDVGGRPDAADKVTGAARYTVDIALDGMVHGMIVRSTEANATIIDVDTTHLLSVQGVLAYTPLDGGDRIRYVGQPIGAVAAADAATARAAVESIDITYVVHPNVVTSDAALADGAPDLHERGWSPPTSSEIASLPNLHRGNLRGPFSLGSNHRYRARRRVSAARENPRAHLVEGVWDVSKQSHTSLEPHACVAHWPAPDRLEVFASTQSVSHLASELAGRFDLEESAVRVHAEHVGGAFGAKQGLTEEVVAAVELSRACGRPVRVVFDSAEELALGGNRPGARMQLEIGADQKGRTSLEFVSHADGGASAGQVIATFARVVYPKMHASLLDYDVLTSTPPGKPFRAPGQPVALFALDQAIDELAGIRGVDPIEFKEQLSPRPLRTALAARARSLPLWSDRDGRRGEGRYLTGVGSSISSWHYGFDPATEVAVFKQGANLGVRCAVQDMGNGTRAMMANAVSQVFGVDQSDVTVSIGDSTYEHGPSSSGSKTTPSVFPTAVVASERLRARLVDDAVLRLGMEGAEPARGGIVHAGELLAWNELLDGLVDAEETAGRPKDSRLPLSPVAIGGIQFGAGFAEGVHLIEAEVDVRLGRIRVNRAWVGLAVGEVHAFEQARSQVLGGVIQGIGYVLYEATRADPASGLNVTSTFDSYRIAGIGDMPEIEMHFEPGGFEHVPGGGVGLAELATVGVAAATANAVAHATGFRPKRMPIRPVDIVQGIRS